MRELVRTIMFVPRDRGPKYTLKLFDINKRTKAGGWYLAYTLSRAENGKRETLFSGEDFGTSPMDAVDSDSTVRGIMGFLTLKRGDTDADYFRNYTPRQLEWRDAEAEELQMTVYDRLGE